MSETPTTDVMSDLYTAGLVAELQPIGSWHAFGEGQDIDYVVFVYGYPDIPNPMQYAVDQLIDEGYTVSSSATPSSSNSGDNFTAMRKGRVNLLVTVDKDFRENSRRAFEVVCALNLRDKSDRIKVHQIIVDGGLHD
jgi:hypothetical protein